MILYRWDKSKNERLFKERGITFEAVLLSIQEGRLLDVVPGKGKYAGQKQFIVEVGRYAHIVPFVERGDEIYLKTIIPSRKMTKKYLRGDIQNEEV